jgi:hypothetical protein
MTKDDIIQDIKKAIEMFGSYTYYDKGAGEVMELDKYVDGIKEMSAKDAIKLLEEVEADEYENTDVFLTDLICDLDDWEGVEADKFFSSDLVGRWY